MTQKFTGAQESIVNNNFQKLSKLLNRKIVLFNNVYPLMVVNAGQSLLDEETLHNRDVVLLTTAENIMDI